MKKIISKIGYYWGFIVAIYMLFSLSLSIFSLGEIISVYSLVSVTILLLNCCFLVFLWDIRSKKKVEDEQ